jgi:hypothetical protein
MRQRLQLLNTLEVDGCGAMDANEPTRIEFTHQFAERHTVEESFPFDVQCDVDPGCTKRVIPPDLTAKRSRYR